MANTTGLLTIQRPPGSGASTPGGRRLAKSMSESSITHQELMACTESAVLKQFGNPRDWPPPFPDDVERIRGALAAMNVAMSDTEIQTFWEEVSDPDGWRSPVDDAEVQDAYQHSSNTGQPIWRSIVKARKT